MIRILLIERNELLQQMFLHMLRFLKHTVETARDRTAAKSLLQTTQVDVVMANERTTGDRGLLLAIKQEYPKVRTIVITDQPVTTNPLGVDAVAVYPPPEGIEMVNVLEEAIRRATTKPQQA